MFVYMNVSPTFTFLHLFCTPARTEDSWLLSGWGQLQRPGDDSDIQAVTYCHTNVLQSSNYLIQQGSNHCYELLKCPDSSLQRNRRLIICVKADLHILLRWDWIFLIHIYLSPSAVSAAPLYKQSLWWSFEVLVMCSEWNINNVQA